MPFGRAISWKSLLDGRSLSRFPEVRSCSSLSLTIDSRRRCYCNCSPLVQKQQQQQRSFWNIQNQQQPQLLLSYRSLITSSHENDDNEASHRVRKTLDTIWFHVYKSKHSDAPDRALQLLEGLLLQSQYQHLEKGVAIHVIRSCSQRHRGKCSDKTTLARLERVLHMLLQLRHNNNNNKAHHLWDEHIPSFALSAMTKCPNRDAPQRAEILLNAMEYNHNQLMTTPPNPIHYGAVLNCYAKRGMAHQAECLLRRMEQHRNITMVVAHYNCVIDALAKSPARDAPQRAEAILNHMERSSNNNDDDDDIQPDVVSYTSILHCYAKRGMSNKAERLLQRMHDQHDAGELLEAPSLHCYNNVIHALAKSSQKDAPQRAEALFHRMVQMHHASDRDDEQPSIQPDRVTGNCLLNCYANHGMVLEAHQLLQQMHHDRHTFKDGPITMEYNCVMNGLAKSNDADAPECAKILLYRMQLYAASDPNIQPDVITFNSLLNCFANAGLVQEAEETLDQMHDLHQKGDLKDGPDEISYRFVIQVLVRSGDRDAIQRAEVLLNQMWASHDACTARQKHTAVKPDLQMYTTLLTGYANEGMAREAEGVLKQMQERLRDGPNTACFNHVMKALSKCSEWDAPDRAETLLAQMLKMNAKTNGPYDSRSSVVRPTLMTYNYLLRCYANEGMGREAEEVLERMHELHKQGDLKDGPNKMSYSIVMELTKERP